jgi:hypothetical protein
MPRRQSWRFKQEHAVFDLIGEGLTNRQIGEKLFLAEKTIKNAVRHRSTPFSKPGTPGTH